MSTQPNFEKIETVTTGYFPYIIGRFHQPGVYVLGVMDLNDPASWSGGETAVVYYFLITPEEYTWLEKDREKLNALAQEIQTNMPRSRFFSTISRKKVDPEQLRQDSEAAIKTENLENDEVFLEWRKTIQMPRVVRVPVTPFNQARHALAVKQKGFDPKTASDADKAELEKLEKELGWMIFKAKELYVAYDTCFNEAFPYLEPARGDVHIFSTEELANTSVKYYEEHHIAYCVVKKIEQADIKGFFRACEDLGVLSFRVDDGVEPVEVKRVNIIPDRTQAYLEERNAAVRNTMLRAMQNGQLLRKHGGEMTEAWKQDIGNWVMTWQRMAFQELGNTVLFVPVALPENMASQMKGNIVYSAAAMEKTRQLMEKAKKPNYAISPPNFKGKNVVINIQQGKLPIRLLKNSTNEDTRMVAFTSRGPAEAFVQRASGKDTVVALTFDQLVEQRESCNGILVDVTGIGMILGAKELDNILEVRDQGRVIYRPKPAQQPAPAPEAVTQAEDAQEGASQEAPVAEPVQDEPTGSAVQPEELSQEENTEGEKKGFFGRFFGKK